ncbi:MAG: hypothetical protein DRN30_02870 [Thermoplasmata archaeon]|nr:MAG: hypothetical protein DRN30_02870 [Thermoplasmata archaeon]
MVIIYAAQTSTIPKLYDNLLISFYHLRNEKKKIYSFLEGFLNYDKVIIDSGGFTAMRKNIYTKQYMESYLRFLDVVEGVVEGYFSLDVPGNFEETLKNHEWMLEQGYKPIPVIHYRYTIEQCKEIVKNSDFYAVGGLVPYFRRANDFQKAKVIKWVIDISEQLKGNIHLFGVGTSIFSFPKEWIKKYVKSVDFSIHRRYKIIETKGKKYNFRMNVLFYGNKTSCLIKGGYYTIEYELKRWLDED